MNAACACRLAISVFIVIITALPACASYDNRGFNPFRDHHLPPVEKKEKGPGGRGDGHGQGAAQERWDAQAEAVLNLPSGYARRFMAQNEWQSHLSRMRTMSPSERKSHIKQTRKSILERAKPGGYGGR